ncbi:endosialin-like [Polypterus senegalus]|nr:endosialin-like [Polypterus senegalus]
MKTPFPAVFLLALLLFSSLSYFSICQELQEQDALCRIDGCYAVYFQRKTFLDSWRSCRDRGGNLATIKRPEEALMIEELLSNRPPRNGAKLRIWIGLQRQPRQCSSTRPLRGFTWVTGDQDTQFTNWLRDDSPSTCSVPRCVVMTHGFAAQYQRDNFKWLHGSCTLPVDGYLCKYNYKGMCRPIEREGGDAVLYSTPFNLFSTLLTHIPFGSVATVPCPEGLKGDQSVLCMQKDDGTIGWSKDGPLCTDRPKHWCGQNNGGCQHFCVNSDNSYHCECSEGYVLDNDAHHCSPEDFCRDGPCEFECISTKDGYLCACPEGYILAANGRDCTDVDECLENPCTQVCTNAPGTFHCHCTEGYELQDDNQCHDIDECQENPCEHACDNIAGSFSCLCNLGYSVSPENPTRCVDTDECQIPGLCMQMCVNYLGGFECHCEEKYELNADGFSCDPISEESLSTSPPHDYPMVTPIFYEEKETSFEDWLSSSSESTDHSISLETEEPHFDWFPTSLPWLTDDPSFKWITTTFKADWSFPFLGSKSTETEDDNSDKIQPATNAPWDHQPTSDSSKAERPLSDLTPFSVSESTANSVSTTAHIWTWLQWATTTEKSIRQSDTTETEVTSTDPLNNSQKANEESKSNEGPKEHRVNHVTDSPESIIFTLVLDPSTTLQYQRHQEGHPGVPEDNKPLEEGQALGITPHGNLSLSGSVTPLGKAVYPTIGSRQQRDDSWLLVALLVPLSIFVVVMLALGIVYCTRCAVRSRSKRVTECYRWITNSSDKTGSGKSSKSRV